MSPNSRLLVQKHAPFEIARDNKARQERDMNYLAGQNTRLKGDTSKLKADVELLKQKLGISQQESAQSVEAQKAADARSANIVTRSVNDPPYIFWVGFYHSDCQKYWGDYFLMSRKKSVIKIVYKL